MHHLTFKIEINKEIFSDAMEKRILHRALHLAATLKIVIARRRRQIWNFSRIITFFSTFPFSPFLFLLPPPLSPSLKFRVYPKLQAYKCNIWWKKTRVHLFKGKTLTSRLTNAGILLPLHRCREPPWGSSASWRVSCGSSASPVLPDTRTPSASSEARNRWARPPTSCLAGEWSRSQTDETPGLKRNGPIGRRSYHDVTGRLRSADARSRSGLFRSMINPPPPAAFARERRSLVRRCAPSWTSAHVDDRTYRSYPGLCGRTTNLDQLTLGSLGSGEILLRPRRVITRTTTRGRLFPHRLLRGYFPPPPNNSTRSVTAKRKMAQFSNGRGRVHTRYAAACEA